jgi:hypothetical protein
MAVRPNPNRDRAAAALEHEPDGENDDGDGDFHDALPMQPPCHTLPRLAETLPPDNGSAANDSARRAELGT